MIVVVLCGGSGTRLEDYSLPKPLNLIYGKPSISYCLQNLPESVQTIHFIAAPHLAPYNFEEIVKSLFKTRTCIVHWLPYFTRGALESALLGTQDLQEESESIVFLDNDVLYRFPNDLFESKATAFLGYAEDTSSSESFSFLKLIGDNVVEYKEKKRISNQFCCGVYGFQSLRQFREATQAVLSCPASTEFYMSHVFQHFLRNNTPVKGIEFESPILHIGSLPELRNAWSHISKSHMRICFDLDNTLVTFPTIQGDYSSVKPIESMIQLAQSLHKEGHTIIIHTARRMTTHKNNVGAVIKDIALITLQTLEKFNIPYDELLFGKPIADLYIDDRAINPYRMSISYGGVLQEEKKEMPLNSLPPNKYNTITVNGSRVLKEGPSEFLRGEIFFYESIQKEPLLLPYFPTLFSSSIQGLRATLSIEHIRGIPAYSLYSKLLLTKDHILSVFEVIDILHNTPGGSRPTREACMANYTDKLKKRFANTVDYPFLDAGLLQGSCLELIAQHEPEPVAYIHGDLWFSNILITYKNEVKCIDMKGIVDGLLTTGGDKYYDYGKLLQSFLGYDSVLYGHFIPIDYKNEVLRIFRDELKKRNISYEKVWVVTFSLVMGSLHFLREEERRDAIWDWIRQTFHSGKNLNGLPETLE